MNDGLLLTLITFLPMIGAMILVVFHNRPAPLLKSWTVGILLADFLLSWVLWFRFPAQVSVSLGENMMVFETKWLWIQTQGISLYYHLGVDGLSLLLILLTTLLGPIVMWAAWDDIQDKVFGFCTCLLLLQTGMLGAFMALDLFLFYIFWECMLIPMYFLIGVWGGTRRVYAAIKLLIYTMVGSVFMLIAILYVGLEHGTFNLLKLYSISFSSSAQHWLFLCFALAFLIKVPMFPFHTWLPDAHVEAPTAGSVILAGVLLKMGTYGFLRLAMPLFPEALTTFTQPLMILAVFGIVYGALVAMVQPDIKKLVAYSSVSHLGFVMLGLLCLNIQGLQGGILQMVNHGLSTGALFLMVGMLYHRRHTRLISEYGGIAQTVPVFAFFFLFVTLSSIGLPGLNGFVGEFLILVGAFGTNKVYAIIAGSGVVLGAVYMLWMYRRVMFGPVTRAENYHIEDLRRREVLLLSVLSGVILWIGLYPAPFLDKTKPAVDALIRHIREYKALHSQRDWRNPVITEPRQKQRTASSSQQTRTLPNLQRQQTNTLWVGTNAKVCLSMEHLSSRLWAGLHELGCRSTLR